MCAEGTPEMSGSPTSALEGAEEERAEEEKGVVVKEVEMVEVEMVEVDLAVVMEEAGRAVQEVAMEVEVVV